MTVSTARSGNSPSQEEKLTPQRGHRSRRAYLALAWVLIGCVIAQVFIAGTALFVDGTRWDLHATFGRIMEAVPLVMLVLAFTGRFPRSVRWLTAGLLGLTVLQSAFIGLADPLRIPEIAALHPVNALAIFALAWTLASRARRSSSTTEGEGSE